MPERAETQYPIHEDMAFQRRAWRIERAAWIAMTLAVLAAALGLLSHGPASRTIAASADGRLAVGYERLERRQAASGFVVRATAAAPTQDIAVRFGPGFLDTYEIRAITPAPLRARNGADGYEAVFAAAGAGENRIHISARAARFGRVDFQVEAAGAAVRVRQFVFP